MSADNVTERARRIVSGAMFGLTTPMMVDAIVSDLDAAGLLVSPAREAEVRADERAKVLAGFEWEPDDCSMEFRTHGQNCQCFGPRTGPRVGRWVGPWEPTP